MDRSILTAEELKRWSFNSLMDFKKPVRSPAECLSFYKSLITEACRILEERRAEAASLPYPVMWNLAQEKEVRAMHAKKDAADARIYAQDAHISKLRVQYSYDLAHSIWFNRVDAQRAIGVRVRDEYRRTYEAEWAEQDAFENAEADRAIAALLADHPLLSEPAIRRIRANIKMALREKGRRFLRGGSPRRLLRGAPLLNCGSFPSKARLIYPPGHNTIYNHCF